MIRGNRPWQPAETARLSWTPEQTPFADQFGDVYFSREDGAAESRHVFLQGNRLPGRWRSHPERVFRIGETGFGTGLNFLLSWRAWLDAPQPKPRLHYLAVEQHPVRPEDLQRALAPWPALKPLLDQLLAVYPLPVAGPHRVLLHSGAVVLDLWWEEAGVALAELADSSPATIDAWYLDGFAPDRNTGMWTAELFDAMAALSRSGATVATFTAAGRVRRGLAEAGFSMRKVTGFGRKRECLQGELPTARLARPPAGTPWDRPRSAAPIPHSALVIGAGLAGCHTAQALACRGVAVTLLEAGAMAGGASGNRQGVLYTRLSHRHSPLVDFALQSFIHGAARYRQLFGDRVLVEGVDGSLCGMFQQVEDRAELARMEPLLSGIPALARVLTADQANELLGITQASAGYWFPASGWLHPPALCRIATDAPGITVIEHCGQLRLQPGEQGWVATTAGGASWYGDCAIVAAGTGSAGCAGLDWLPLQSIRGQTNDLPSTTPFDDLDAVLCHSGYIAPARQGRHTIGATFDQRDGEQNLRREDQLHNLRELGRAVPGWRAHLESLAAETLEGRVGFRCASRDYLPLVGPVPDREGFLRSFAALGKNGKREIGNPGDYVRGLYLNCGHGSRGLSSTPLSGELLASLVCHEPLPMSRELCRALAPARFVIRDIIRGRLAP